MRNTAAGVPHTTEVFSIKDYNETKSTVLTYSSSIGNTDMEEAVSNKYDDQSKSRKSKSTATKKRRKQNRRIHSRHNKMRINKASNPEMERQRLIYNTGTDCEVFEKVWHIYHRWNGNSITLDGALAGMESTKDLPMVAAVTAIDTPTGTKLLGLIVSF